MEVGVEWKFGNGNILYNVSVQWMTLPSHRKEKLSTAFHYYHLSNLIIADSRVKTSVFWGVLAEYPESGELPKFVKLSR